MAACHAQPGGAACRRARAPPGGAGTRFYVLDGTRPDAPEAGFWRRLAPVLPHATKVGLVRESAELLAEIAAEVARRQEEGQDKAPPHLPADLQPGPVPRPAEGRRVQLRRLRRGKPASPAKQFAAILREGPAVGVHTLDLVRQLRHAQPHVGSAGPARLRDAGALPDEPHRFEQPDGQPGRQPAGGASGDLLRRRARPHGEVSPVRPAVGRLAGLGPRQLHGRPARVIKTPPRKSA